MCASLSLQQDHISRRVTPPPTPNQIPFLIHHIQELGIEDDEQQLRDFFDHAFPGDYDVCHSSGLMSYAIPSNKVCLVEELLRRKLPTSFHTKNRTNSIQHSAWGLGHDYMAS